MKVLITGGAGFIGSHLAHARLARGDQVDVFDDLSTGSMDNVEPLLAHAAYRFILGNIVDDPAQVEEAVRRCDVVFHLAAAVGVRRVLDNPLVSMRTNLNGTQNVLDACTKYGKRVLLASSSEVYGKNLSRMRESDDLRYGSSKHPRWSYAATKLLDEFLALAYFRAHGVPVVIARIFNTAGPRQTDRYGMVLPRFVRAALAGEPITVYGDGMQTRTFTHVADTVEALDRLMDCEEAIGEVVNVGGREEVTIRALAERVKARAESDSPIQFVPYATAFSSGFEDMRRRAPSTEKLRRLIGFVPAIPLDAIIDDVIFWWRKIV